MAKEYRIMVIDDEKIVGDMAKLSLEQEGYQVETFSTPSPRSRGSRRSTSTSS